VRANSDILWITAHARDATLAARIANAFAVEYRDFRARSARATVDAALSEAQRRLRLLGAGTARSAFGRRLAAQVGRLQVGAALQTGGVQIVRPATPPDSPAGVDALKAATVAAVLGLFLAGALILLLTRRNQPLYSEDDVERAVGLPVLASIPPVGRWPWTAAGTSEDLELDGSHEAYVTLAARLAYSRLGMAPRVILLTSPEDDGATSSVALGLARALGTIGRTALAIEADLRCPRWASELDLESSDGLTGLLLGERTLESELLLLPDGRAPTSPTPTSGGGSAWALPVGLPVSQPESLLADSKMAALVHDAWERTDFVLLAGPPMTREGEALALAALSDGALLVVRQRTTTEDAARRAVRSLDDVDLTMIGAVVTDVPRRLGGHSMRQRGRPTVAGGRARTVPLPTPRAADAHTARKRASR
jgi:polysaccharide biosynthesis transport protein